MRHASNHKKLNRTSSHRQALLANLSLALITHEQIKTTVPKAKFLRAHVEKLITKAKNAAKLDAAGKLAARRYLLAALKQEDVVEKLMAEIGPFFAERPGGYTRIMRAGVRHGDMAPVAIMELVGRDHLGDKNAAKDGKQAKAEKKTAAKKASPAKKDGFSAKSENKPVKTAKKSTASVKSTTQRRTAPGA